MSQYVFTDWGKRENYMRQEQETYHNYSGEIRDLQEWPCGLFQFLDQTQPTANILNSPYAYIQLI